MVIVACAVSSDTNKKKDVNILSLLSDLPSYTWCSLCKLIRLPQYVMPRGGIFLGKWRSSFTGSSDGKKNVQSACTLNTRYMSVKLKYMYVYISIFRQLIF
jgi:hypothetical protein